jgi:pimeloyl-ACP methyl ester carboxylesterase
VLPALERRHDVLALTLAGHAGGPPIEGALTDATLADAVERAMDEAGFELAHLVGNSLGGYVALQLAARGRARTVVALAPAGGWAEGDDSYKDTLAMQSAMLEELREIAAHGGAVAPAYGPPELLADQMLGAAVSAATGRALIDHALRAGWDVDAERITCPVRVVWGTADRLLPWPAAAARYRRDWLPHADWVVLEGVGHSPQLEVPVETGAMILGFTSP